MNEKEILKLVLSGNSVIDGIGLEFKSMDEVEQLLNKNEFRLSTSKDTDRLMAIHNEAVGYLQKQIQMDLPPEVLEPDKIKEIFLLASNKSTPKLQTMACSVLKTMHAINHIDGQELIFHLPISVKDIFNLVSDKVERCLAGPLRKKFPGMTYSGGRKQKESLITKLLAKKETAGRINDRVRYQIVVPTKEHISQFIVSLFDSLLPINYVVPNASLNNLIPPLNEGAPKDHDFTSKNYQVVRLTVDVPVRLDRFVEASRIMRTESLGSMTHALVEFQIVDEETDINNNQGDSEHAEYKARQKEGVRNRLLGKK